MPNPCQWKHTVFCELSFTFYLTDPSSITHISDNRTLDQNDTVTLNCTTDGNPPPNITWTRLSDNSIVTFPLTITGKKDEGGYRCTANNSIGNPVSSDAFVTVQSKSNIVTIF